MKFKLVSIVAAAILAAGCFNSNSCINQTQGPTPLPTATPSPTPSPSASPTPGTSTIRTVEANGFGEQSCPAGVTPSCTDGSICRTLKLGCSRAYTCTAYTADGRDAGGVIPGLTPSFFDAITGKGNVATITRDSVNPAWNLVAKAVGPGSFQLQCTVGGVSIDPASPFVITIVP
jgi:hypothetical protein